ncbi:hypothetical protein QOT17_002838 [Balamuthia mandrillaris]
MQHNLLKESWIYGPGSNCQSQAEKVSFFLWCIIGLIKTQQTLKRLRKSASTNHKLSSFQGGKDPPRSELSCWGESRLDAWWDCTVVLVAWIILIWLPRPLSPLPSLLAVSTVLYCPLHQRPLGVAPSNGTAIQVKRGTRHPQKDSENRNRE